MPDEHRMLHKSDAAGVVLGLAGEDELRAAYAALGSRLGSRELSVEAMAPVGEGVELIVGAKRDPRFGAVVLVGLGGIHAELLDDVAVALAPVGEAEAERLVRSLRGAPLLTGARGRAPLDVGAAARAVAALSRAAAATKARAPADPAAGSATGASSTCGSTGRRPSSARAARRASASAAASTSP